MASLQTYLTYTILGLFVFVSVFGFIGNFSASTNTQLDDDFATNTTEQFKTKLETDKNKIDQLSNEALESNADADSNDILGSWLVAGFQNIRNTFSGAKELTTTANDGVEVVSQYAQPESHVKATIFLYLGMLGLIIVLAIIIERQGVSKK